MDNLLLSYCYAFYSKLSYLFLATITVQSVSDWFKKKKNIQISKQDYLNLSTVEITAESLVASADMFKDRRKHHTFQTEVKRCVMFTVVTEEAFMVYSISMTNQDIVFAFFIGGIFLYTKQTFSLLQYRETANQVVIVFFMYL